MCTIVFLLFFKVEKRRGLTFILFTPFFKIKFRDGKGEGCRGFSFLFFFRFSSAEWMSPPSSTCVFVFFIMTSKTGWDIFFF